MADFVVGDSNSSVVATLIRGDGSILDLSAVSTVVTWKYRIGSVVYAPLTMTILTPPENGRVQLIFAAIDLATEGIMYAEIEVTQPVGLILSSEFVLEFTVRGKAI